MMEICNDVLKDEIELLSEIYYKELSYSCDSSDCTVVQVIIKPNTCDDTDKQFIRLILAFKCSSDYPAVPPSLTLLQPRGLEEEELVQLRKDIERLAQEKINEPMLYDLILFAKDVITNQNLPHTLCSICLDTFMSECDVYKTSQFHFFHKQCIANYIDFEIKRHEKLVSELFENDKFAKNIPELSIQCPLCRQEDIHYDLEFVKKYNVPFETVEIDIPEEWRQKANEMKARHERQLQMVQDNINAASAAPTVSQNCGTDVTNTDNNFPRNESSGRQIFVPNHRSRGRSRGRGDRRYWRGGKNSKDQKGVPRENSQGHEGRLKNNFPN